MRADKFLYVFYVLQYVNGHAVDSLLHAKSLFHYCVFRGEIFDNFAFFILKEYAVDIH